MMTKSGYEIQNECGRKREKKNGTVAWGRFSPVGWRILRISNLPFFSGTDFCLGWAVHFLSMYLSPFCHFISFLSRSLSQSFLFFSFGRFLPLNSAQLKLCQTVFFTLFHQRSFFQELSVCVSAMDPRHTKGHKKSKERPRERTGDEMVNSCKQGREATDLIGVI